MKKEKKTKIQKMNSRQPDTKRKSLRVKKTYIPTSYVIELFHKMFLFRLL